MTAFRGYGSSWTECSQASFWASFAWHQSLPRELPFRDSMPCMSSSVARSLVFHNVTLDPLNTQNNQERSPCISHLLKKIEYNQVFRDWWKYFIFLKMLSGFEFHSLRSNIVATLVWWSPKYSGFDRMLWYYEVQLATKIKDSSSWVIHMGEFRIC